jgi:hypothetical protein
VAPVRTPTNLPLDAEGRLELPQAKGAARAIRFELPAVGGLLWWRWSPTGSGGAVVDTTGSTAGVTVGIFREQPGGAPVPVAVQLPSPGRWTFQAESGTAYLVAAGVTRHLGMFYVGRDGRLAAELNPGMPVHGRMRLHIVQP